MNADSLLSSVNQYVLAPASSTVESYNLSPMHTQIAVTALSQFEYALVGCAINLIIPLFADYAIFKRSDVRGD